MTREELKAHCEKQIEMCEMWAIGKGEKPSGKIYEEHKLILELLDQEPRWIPLTKRSMTEEETEHYFEYTDMRIDDTYTILDCPLPDDGQEVIVSWRGNVGNDVFNRDNEGCYFEGVDIDDVDAWMPLPKPYKENKE